MRSPRILFAVLGLALVAAGLMPWPVPRRSVEAALASSFRDAGGSTLAIRGRTAFALLPTPRLIARDIEIARDAVRITAGDLRLSLDPLELLGGRISAHALHLGDAVASAPVSDAPSPGALLVGALSRGIPSALPLDAVTFRNGTVKLGGRNALERVSGVWSGGGGASPALTAEGFWRGEAVKVAMTLPPNRATRDAAAPVSLAVVSRPLTLQMDGTLGAGEQPRVKGRLAASTVDGVDLARWLGAAPPIPGRLDSVSIDGVLDAGPADVTISDARVTLNGDTFEGAVGLRLEGERPLLSATLATAAADVTDQLGFVSPRRSPDDSWSREPFETTARFSPCDLDIRVSAGALTFNRMALERAAFSVFLRGDRLEFALAEAHVGQGSLKGRLILSSGPNGMEMKSSASIDQFDIGPALLAITGGRRLGGAATGTLSLDSVGRSTLQLAQNATGKLAFAVKDGTLFGVDLDRFLLRLERRSTFAALDLPVGETPFSRGGFTGTIARGRLDASEGFFESPSLNIRYSGQSDAANRLIDLSGSVSQAAAAGHVATVVPFTVRGSWSAPRISADLESLRRKS